MTLHGGFSGSEAGTGDTGIKALGAQALADVLTELGEPRFRSTQILGWLYRRSAKGYAEMTDLPARLRSELARHLPLFFPKVVERQVSKDGTRKYLVRLIDGVLVETVGLPVGDRLTVCFSTQAGCAMGCRFCATGFSGFQRNLHPGEMVDQLNIVANDFDRRVTGAVAMGQGEPFANYQATLDALRLMNHAHGPQIGARHLTVSTCGILPAISRFAEEPEQFTLAVSLHSAVQSTRDALMPGVRSHALPRLRDALIGYAAQTGRRPSLEYALADGVNDSDAELDALVAFSRDMLVHVNLIPINPVAESNAVRASASRVATFARKLAAAGIEVSVRAERGADIAAACGQLRQRATSGGACTEQITPSAGHVSQSPGS
ncbi:MAG: 23S rRNA (adenine(2503)-C(2))-methyltransferase RlmN [Coriobacteriia bacterium]|nr:23S rRNA (adenine(2503)-C(2))-methyltransferase RlmN [Coriobacteriia bacterium]